MSRKSETSKKLKTLLSLTLSFLLLPIIPAIADPTLKCNSVAECQALFEKTTNSFIGASYSYGSSGGSGGRKSFDCSGLVLSVINKVLDHAALPRTSQAMYSSISHSVSLADAKRGDLLFFNTGSGVSHVGIYWGKDEKNRPLMFHSSSSKGVELRPLQGDKYWMSRLVGVKRFTPFTNALILPSLPQMPDLAGFGKAKNNKSSKTEANSKAVTSSNKEGSNEKELKEKSEKDTHIDSTESSDASEQTKSDKDKSTSNKKNKAIKLASGRKSNFKPMKKSYTDYLSSFQFEDDQPEQAITQSKAKAQKVSYIQEELNHSNQAVAYGDIQDPELSSEDSVSSSNLEEYFTDEEYYYSNEYVYY